MGDFYFEPLSARGSSGIRAILLNKVECDTEQHHGADTDEVCHLTRKGGDGACSQQDQDKRIFKTGKILE